MVFSVVMYGWESWTIKKAERWRIDAFELRCWRRLESLLDCKTPSQSILKEISMKYSLEGLMLKLNFNTLATWCEELTHWKRPWCWERLKAGGEGGNRGWDGWMASPTQWTWVWASFGNWWQTGKPGMLQSMGSTEWLNWTEFKITSGMLLSSYVFNPKMWNKFFLRITKLVSSFYFSWRTPLVKTKKKNKVLVKIHMGFNFFGLN